MIEFFREYWIFLKARKKLWMLPIIILLLLTGFLLFAVQGLAGSPFIYTLF